MPDTPIEAAADAPYPADMPTRVAILETIAERGERTHQAILTELRDIRIAPEAQARDLRAAIETQGREFRAATETQGRDLRAAVDTQGRDLRTALQMQQRVHDRDFRLTFGGIITAAIGLGYLIAHWL